MTSQPPLASVCEADSAQQPTVIQTVSLPPPTTQIQRRDRIRFSDSHKVLGILQMIAGNICFFLSIIGFIVRGTTYYFGSGIYSGIIFFITGLLGYMAYRKQDRCFIISCMLMNVIGFFTAVIAMSFASIEVSTANAIRDTTPALLFQRAKVGIIITICVTEFVITIVHASFTCASCCDCCYMPRDVPRQSAHATGTAAAQGAYSAVPQGPVYTPQQRHGVQQSVALPQQPMIAPPPYEPTQSTYFQNQIVYSPPMDPPLTYGAPIGNQADAPPPYSEIDERK